MSLPVDVPLHALGTGSPAIDAGMAERIARDHFGVESRAEVQASERDANFRLHCASGSGCVLRIAGEAEDRAALELELAALEHIARQDPGLAVPRVLRARNGAALVDLRDADDQRCSARLLSFLPGETLDGKPAAEGLLISLGDTMARVDEALRGFFHPGADRRIAWNPACAPQLLPHAGLIEDAALARLVREVLEEACESLLPRLQGLRSQVLHADANTRNVLVEGANPVRIAGLIDFGDCLYAARIAEVAIAASDLQLESDDPVAVAASVLAGYHARAPLAEADLAVLNQLGALRLAATLAILAWRQHHEGGPGDEYPGYGAAAAETLARLVRTDASEALARFRAACGLGAGATVAAPVNDPATLIERRRRVLGSRLELSYSRPVYVVRGEGVWLHEADGSRCLDAYNNVPHVGHSHPRVTEAVSGQVARLNTNTRYLYDIVLDYAERLAASLPGPLSVCVFVNSGSEANDVAWRMVKAVTGRSGALVMRHAYHGITDAVDELAPYDKRDDQIASHVRTLTPPDVYRGPHRGDPLEAGRRYAAEADAAIESLRAAGHEIAALMVDSALCSEGMLQAPPGYLAAVAGKVRAAGGLVIADEVQAGFGRLGDAFWGHQVHGVQADLVTMGKPIANGIPLGAVVTRADIHDAFTERVDFFSTFGGNPVACAAGMAVLQVTAEEGLQANARLTGAFLLEGLRELQTRHALIGDVRGRGLSIGVELVRDRQTLEPAAAERKQVMNALRERGVLVGADGPHGNVLKIRPPMPFARSHAERLLAALDEVLSELRPA